MTQPQFLLIKAVDDEPQRELLDAVEVAEKIRRGRIVLIERMDGSIDIVKNQWGPTGPVEVVVQHEDYMPVSRQQPLNPVVASAMRGSTDTLVPQA